MWACGSSLCVACVCADINDLKFVLNTISDIQQMNMDMELQFAEIAEKFRSLKMYRVYKNIPPSAEIKQSGEEPVDHNARLQLSRGTSPSFA